MPDHETDQGSSESLKSRGCLIAMLSIAFLVATGGGILIARKVFQRASESRAVSTTAEIEKEPATNSVEPPSQTSPAITAGALDETFRRSEIIGPEVRSLVLQRDGKILLSGYFDKVDGEWHNSVARFHADGTLDSSFKAKAGGSVHAIAVQPDGKILLAGDFRVVNGIAHRTVARVHSDGRLDETFNTGRAGDKEAYALALQPDGKILVAGSFTSFDGATHLHFVRLNANGSVDPSFNGKADQGPTGMIVQPDGNILICGSFSRPSSPLRYGLVRLQPDGTSDRSFKPPRLDDSTAMTLMADGKILIATRKGPVVRLNPDGSVDTTFLSGLVVDRRITVLALDSHGRILVVGGFTTFGDFVTRSMARLNSDGSLDQTFRSTHEFHFPLMCAAVTANGDVVVGGNFTERLLRFRGTAPPSN